MGEATQGNQAISHTQSWGQKVGLKGRKKENKNKIQRSGFDPLCVKIPCTYQASALPTPTFFFLTTKVGIPVSNPGHPALLSNALNEAAFFFKSRYPNEAC